MSSIGREVRLNPLLLAASVLLSCYASSFELDWSTVDGGGVTEITGGTMSLSGTAGQPDAGELPGGTMRLYGGFWFPRSATISNTTILPSQNPAKTGTPIAFTSNATQSENQPLTFLWDFGDGTTATGSSVTHAFTVAGAYNVVLKVSDGFGVAVSSMSVQILAPASGSTTDSVNPGNSATNPLDGTSIKVVSSDGGVLELEIGVNGAPPPPGTTVTTVIQGPTGALATITGDKPVFKFTEPGIYVVTTTVTDGTGQIVGEAAITIPIGNGETGGTSDGLTPPASHTIVIQGLKGKFLFRENKPDVVSFKGSIELPGGLPLPKQYVWSLSAGNVADTLSVTTKGKGIVPGAQKRITKLQVKYPRLRKPAAATSTGQRAAVSFTLSVPDLDSLGFDTEGIGSTVRPDEAALKSVSRTIQLAMLFAGTPYAGKAPVQLKLSKNKDTGQIVPTRASH